MIPPGRGEMPPSDLVMRRSGAAATGSTSVAVLLPGVGSAPFEPSFVTLAVFVIVVTPAGSGLLTVTVTRRVVEAPLPAREKEGQVTEPLPNAPLLLAKTKVVFTGIVSVTSTPVAVTLPLFMIVSV